MSLLFGGADILRVRTGHPVAAFTTPDHYCTALQRTVLYPYYDKRGCNVSVLGQDEGYTVKYSPPPERVPEGTPKGVGLYLTVYPSSCPNTDTV